MIYDEFDIEISLATVYRELRRVRWSRKVVQARAAERNESLREAWRSMQLQFSTDQLIFLDESGANERTGDRKFGWSLQGFRCGVSRPVKRSERWSILPALTINGYLSWVVFQGAITAAIFEYFLEVHVLPQTTPYPGPRSVLILDNASIHRSQRVVELCEAHGVLLKFLPPYSPDYNPIENTFHDLKAWIRRNYQMAAEFDDFGAFLEFAISQNLGTHARKHFEDAGYV